jgi:glycerate 2-kinase
MVIYMPDREIKTGPQWRARTDLLRIFAAAVGAVEPRRVVAGTFEGRSPKDCDVSAMVEKAKRIYLLAVGKAAPGMALEARDQLGAKFCDALVIAPIPTTQDIGLRLMPAAHPKPDTSSEVAGRAARQFVAAAGPDDLIVLLLSGGASALMALPAEGLTLQDKVNITSALMNVAAPIRELNTVRKHLSGIKGGRLLHSSVAAFLTLIISDVPGNDLATIGSGPTAEDPTTYADAIAILKRHKLWGRAPEAVRAHLERGAAGEILETVKSGDPALRRVHNVIVANNGTAVEAACSAAAALGYKVDRWRELSGDANRAGALLATYLRDIELEHTCVIAGGETVVPIKGNGRGGRSQQAALAAAVELARHGSDRRIAMLFAGTDGIDGPTDAAGAIATPATVSRATEAKVDPQSALERNDSYTFFKALGDLVITGPTGTNVADLFIGLVNY